MRRTMRSRFSTSLLLSALGMLFIKVIEPNRYNRNDAQPTRKDPAASGHRRGPLLFLAYLAACRGILLPIRASGGCAADSANPGFGCALSYFCGVQSSARDCNLRIHNSWNRI